MSQAKPNPKAQKRNSPLDVQPLKLWNETRQEEEVRIEIIPLIDVIFCILTFFILAAVGFSRQQAISLDLPKASTGAPQMREMLIVSLDDFGQVYVEQQPVNSRNQLYQAVENYFLTRPDGLMVLYASKEARYDEVIQVLDILKEVGGDRVALATLPEGTEAPDSPTTPETPLPDNPFPTLPGMPQEEQLNPGFEPTVPETEPTSPNNENSPASNPQTEPENL
ncbi:biopolymer transporter ExbD [Spirulina sp. CS-785/01]|uniref:ExbD/TolR family protein n=1 Tax=Spirulina sp. CS-785/01 TaxID=3021716 RepID=UPI00232CE001|nr:biopolymer transporter ExbD [Spirulina sp. CS-785/01]MDB9313855.1 biopolymer transporter ExbD [Spirulina sp. CS-785/01]